MAGKKKILLVEDSETDAARVRDQLEDGPYELIWVKTGEEALVKIKEVAPDLVVLDIGLPGIDGFKVCSEIKKMREIEPLSVMILSSKESVEDIKKAFDAGANDYLIKPPRAEYLVNKIKIYFGDK